MNEVARLTACGYCNHPVYAGHTCLNCGMTEALKFTKKESRIANEFARGKSVKQIAFDHNLDYRTVASQSRKLTLKARSKGYVWAKILVPKC